jgi:hypothetical protein
MKFGLFAPLVWVYLNTTVRDRGIRRHATGSYVPIKGAQKGENFQILTFLFSIQL